MYVLDVEQQPTRILQKTSRYYYLEKKNCVLPVMEQGGAQIARELGRRSAQIARGRATAPVYSTTTLVVRDVGVVEKVTMSNTSK